MLTERPSSVVARRNTVPLAIEKAIHTALQKLPADRFASTVAFSAALASAGSDATGTTPPPVAAQPRVTSRSYRLSEDACRRLARTSFDPRLIGSSMHYLDNGVESDVLVCYIPACGRAADQYDKVLETASYRGLAVTFRGFEPVTNWRPSLQLADHMVLVRELLREAVARLRPRVTIIGGFSSGADVAMRLAAAPDPDSRLRLDGCLALGTQPVNRDVFPDERARDAEGSRRRGAPGNPAQCQRQRKFARRIHQPLQLRSQRRADVPARRRAAACLWLGDLSAVRHRDADAVCRVVSRRHRQRLPACGACSKTRRCSAIWCASCSCGTWTMGCSVPITKRARSSPRRAPAISI